MWSSESKSSFLFEFGILLKLTKKQSLLDSHLVTIEFRCFDPFFQVDDDDDDDDVDVEGNFTCVTGWDQAFDPDLTR